MKANHPHQEPGYLDANGMAIALPKWAEVDALKALYRTLKRTRLLDDKAIALQRTGQLGTYPSSEGQEAIFVAIGHCMKKEDVLCPYYRDQGALLQRGHTEADILRYWGGHESGGKTNFAGHQDMPISVPIASQCQHASGIAYAMTLQQKPNVVVCTLGDGATSEGDFYEALNMAGLYKLPVVFVINNNQWAISTPLGKQTANQHLALKANGTGAFGMQVDGNDIVAMIESMNKALMHARSNQGPVLLEAISYRLCDHTTADDGKRYQDQDEWAQAKHHDPIKRLNTYLKPYWKKDEKEAMIDALKQDLANEVSDYLATPSAPIADGFDHMYAHLPLDLIQQKEVACHE